MNEKYDVCIVGAGIIGMSTAYFLSKKSLKICIVDECDDVAMVTSKVNGGQINPHRIDHLEVYAKGKATLWDIVKIGLFYPIWGLNHMHYRRKLRLNKHLSWKMTRDIQSAATQTFLQMKKMQWDGLKIGKRAILDDMVDPLKPCKKLAIDEYPIATGSSHALAQFMKKKMTPRTDFFFNHRFKSFVHHRGKVSEIITVRGNIKPDTFIVTMGLGLSRWFPLLPIYGLIREYPFSRSTLFNTKHILIASMPKHHAYMSVVGDVLRVGGGDIIAPIKPTAAAFHLPRWKNSAPQREWIGCRPVSPDGMPIIGKLPGFKNVYVNGGHGFWGWTLSLGTAKILAYHVVHRRYIPFTFSTERFI